MKRKLVSLVLCGCLVAGMFPAMALADNSQNTATSPVVTAEEAATSGECGPNLTWTYDQETQTLTISGTGDMWDRQNNWSHLDVAHVILEEGVTSIASSAFAACTSLTDIIIPEGVTSIGAYAFSNCESLREIDIPEGVTTIEEWTFQNCTSLTKVSLPKGLTTIDSNAFFRCIALAEFNLPESVTDIGWSAFQWCQSLPEIVIPKGVTTIGDSAFWGCTDLTKVTIAEGVTTIGNSAFWGCTGLTELVLPESVTSIESLAFASCDNLTKISLPEGLTTIGEYVFSGCVSLSEIAIPKGVTFIGEDAFDGCRNLNTIFFGGTTEEWEALNAEALSYNPYIVTIVCADGTISVAEPKGTCGDDLTWSYDRNSKTLTISGTGDMWEYDMVATDWRDFEIAHIELKKGITSIGSGAFYQCSNLEKLVIPDGVTSIGNGAIYECTSLKEITIPDSVTLIDYTAFHRCDNLTTVYYTGTPEQWAAISVGDYNDALSFATIYYNYNSGEPEPTPTPDPTPEPTPEPTPTPAPQDKVDIPVSGDKAEATVGRVDLVLNNAGTVFAPGTVITVEAITQGSAYDTAKKALSSTGAMMDSAAVLEFTATRDGKPVQPDGSLSVTFSIPSNLSPTNLKLFYVSEDGQYQEIPITVDVDARTATAELSHFSTYVLANIAPATGGGQGSDTSDSQVPPTNEEPVPPTGDTSALPLYVCVLTMAMAGLSIVLISKRKA